MSWNVIVTVSQWHFKGALRMLRPLGVVSRTRFYNVLTLEVDDVAALLETLREWWDEFPDTAETIMRVSPVSDAFEFDSLESYEAGAREVLERYLPQLAGCSFHVRMHRRGGPPGVTSYSEERRLGGLVFEQLQQAGTPARVTFDDPDAVICVETLDGRAGLALWPRQQLQRYPFLKMD